MLAGSRSVRLAYVLVGLALSLVLLHPVHGAGHAKSSPAAGPPKSPPAAGGTANLVAELKGALQLLAQARHDYEGHRLRAVHEITAAIQALEMESQQSAPTSGPKPHGTSKGTTQPPVTKPPTQQSPTRPPTTKPPVQPPTTKPPTTKPPIQPPPTKPPVQPPATKPPATSTKPPNQPPTTKPPNQQATTKPTNQGSASGSHDHSSGSKKTRETQGESDAELKQAMSQLKAVEGQMGNKHPQAKSFLQAAIAELQTALKIR
jgi:hypothetical protein